MYQRIQIHEYRSFEHFELESLGRVNLIVGSNGSGKTSVLEAVYLLAEGARFSLSDIAFGRGELTLAAKSSSESGRTYLQDIRHLFRGHEYIPGSRILLEAQNVDRSGDFVSLTIVREEYESGPQKGDGFPVIQLKSSAGSESHERELRPDAEGFVVMSPGKISFNPNRDPRPGIPRLLTTEGIMPITAAGLIEQLLLHPEEELLLDALRLIDDSIERIATVGEPGRDLQSNRGVIVKLKHTRLPVPIGSLGNGIWRLLGVVLKLIASRNSVLLIDEIDTGLHYTVMEKMWKLIFEASKQLNVQVFATTHSRDCIDALASISREGVFENSEVMIHRIEAGKSKSISYSEATIKAVAEFGNEVR